MMKRYSTILLLSILVLTTHLAIPSQPGLKLYWSLDIKANPPLKIGTSFHITVTPKLYEKADSASLNITLSKGIQLIKGNLHWQDRISPDSIKSSDIIVEIDTVGMYEISAVFIAWNKHLCKIIEFDSVSQTQRIVRVESESGGTKIFPYPSYLSFNAQRDSVELFYCDRNEMVWQIKRRTEDSLHQKQKEALYRSQYVPQLFEHELNSIVYSSRGYFSDSSYYPSVRDYNEHIRDHLILEYQLLFKPPDTNKIEKFVLFDFRYNDTVLTDKQVARLVKVIKSQLSELYTFDQRILNTQDQSTRFDLIRERNTLLLNQKEERIKISGWKPKKGNW